MFVGALSHVLSSRRVEAVLQARWLVPLVIFVGIALRTAWLALRRTIDHAGGEAVNAAVAFAQTGTLSDSFQLGQGPTAHLTPIPPLIAGVIYSAFGVMSFSSEFLLMLWSLGLTAFGSWYLFKAFEAAGTSRLALLLGLAGFWLLPMNFHLEVVMFRVWEGSLAAALAAYFIYRLIVADQQRDTGFTEIAWLSLVAAILFLVSPPLGLAGYAAALLLMIRTQPSRRWISIMAAAAIALAVVLAPWTIRNERVMGTLIPLRSNFGLELAIANHPAAARGGDDKQIFLERMREVHPYTSRVAYGRLQQAGGEVAYAEKLGRETRDWIAQHPTDFARLSAKHVSQFFFPPAWFYAINDNSSQAVKIRQSILWALSLLGLAGVALVLMQRRRRFDYLVIMVLVPVLPYAITQPILRYRYLTYASMMFFAAIVIAALLSRLGRTFAQKVVVQPA
jgi:hypothetical protein